jgi:hypothetical protein
MHAGSVHGAQARIWPNTPDLEHTLGTPVGVVDTTISPAPARRIEMLSVRLDIGMPL